MSVLWEPLDADDWRFATGVDGLLGAFNRAGVIESGDIAVARRLGALGGEDDERVLLAAALACWAVRHGSVCLDLAALPTHFPADLGLDWPEGGAWREAVAASTLVTAGVLRVEHGLVYLDRYHRLETQVADDLIDREQAPPPSVDDAALAAALARVGAERFSAEQATGVERAVRRWTTVLTGGPGTGKTSTVARLLAVLVDQAVAQGRRCSIALSAPTGKAAARLQEAVVEAAQSLPPDDRDRLPAPAAMTLHRLLGWRPDNTTRFRHDRRHRLPYDVVVVDECSMVDLTLMARLLEAVPSHARLVLMGDAGQLTSVGAGAVLADVVAGLGARSPEAVSSLTHNYRSTRDILTLADAIRAGDADAALEVLRAGSAEVEFLETDDPETALRPRLTERSLAVRDAALTGDAEAAIAALDRHRLLCAHREGRYGVRRWNQQVETWLAEDGPGGADHQAGWYAGRPLLVTSNDYALGVYNGETGVVVRRPDDTLRVCIVGAGGLLDFAPGRLGDVETMHALTIHKSQGSQADTVTVLLPDEGSRLLTRELFYTAVTRAQQHVTVVGSEASVRAAVTTTAQRATGLRRRLAP